jgi:hypothetical protein
MCVLFAVAHPDRTSSLALYGTGPALPGRPHPGGCLVELPGEDHVPFLGDTDRLADELEEFLTGTRPSPEDHRMLTTVLFTDIVGSTAWAEAAGDHSWQGTLERHRAIVRRELDRFGGTEMDTAGDSFFATFDGPARAIRAALAMINRLEEIGVRIRAGVHTGEVEREPLDGVPPLAARQVGEVDAACGRPVVALVHDRGRRRRRGVDRGSGVGGRRRAGRGRVPGGRGRLGRRRDGGRRAGLRRSGGGHWANGGGMDGSTAVGARTRVRSGHLGGRSGERRGFRARRQGRGGAAGDGGRRSRRCRATAGHA